MSHKKQLFLYFGLLVIAGALYRIIPDRMFGFAPQIAMALFGGSVIKDKKWAFALPLLSMFISDLLYHIMYIYNINDMQGFYKGQWVNYLLFAGITVFGFFINPSKLKQVVAATLAAPTIYFLISNFLTWIGGGGYHRAKTFSGMIQCYEDAIPFYKGSLLATMVFAAIFFGVYYMVNQPIRKKQVA